MQSIKDAQQMGSEKKRQTDEEEQMRNKKLERQTLLTHRDLYQISKSDRKYSVLDRLCYVLAKTLASSHLCTTLTKMLFRNQFVRSSSKNPLSQPTG